MQSTRTGARSDLPPTRPEHPYRPDSGRSDTGQSNASVKNLDALLGSNCVVF